MRTSCMWISYLICDSRELSTCCNSNLQKRTPLEIIAFITSRNRSLRLLCISQMQFPKRKKKNASASNRIYCPEEFSTRRFYFQSLLNRCTKTGIFFSKKQGRKKQVQEKLQKKHCCWGVACIQCRPKLSTSCPFTVTTKKTLSKKTFTLPLCNKEMGL